MGSVVSVNGASWVAIVALSWATSCKKAVPDPVDAGPPAVASQASPPTPSASAEVLAPCDADALWYATVPDGPSEFTDNRTKAVGIMAAWSLDCRKQAMTNACGAGCDDLITDMIIDAEPGGSEKLDLTRIRRDKNTETLAVSLAFIAKVKEFVARAKALSTVPRGDDGCIARMLNDFKTIDALTAGLDQIKGAYGVAVLPTRSVLAYAKSCVDCSDDRRLCADMVESDKTTDENVSEARTLIQKDTRTLGGK